MPWRIGYGSNDSVERIEMKTNANSNKIRIQCFESSGLEVFPSNTYETNSINAALNCIKDVLTNKNSSISRILIENLMFADSSCYKNINAMSPMPI